MALGLNMELKSTRRKGQKPARYEMSQKGPNLVSWLRIGTVSGIL